MNAPKKDIHETNSLVRWGLLLGTPFFGVLTILILFIDFEILRNREVTKDLYFRILLFLVAIVSSIIIIRKTIEYLAAILNTKYLTRFSLNQNNNTDSNFNFISLIP